jgi:hypothetical protein
MLGIKERIWIPTGLEGIKKELRYPKGMHPEKAVMVTLSLSRRAAHREKEGMAE